MLGKDQGFTLVEITMAMIISSALGVLVFGFFAPSIREAQFHNTMEGLKSSIYAQRQNVMSTKKLSGGTDSAKVSFGRLLVFTNGSPTVSVKSLEVINSDVIPAGTLVQETSGEESTIDLSWGAVYSGPSTSVAFLRSPTTGKLTTFVRQPAVTRLASGEYYYSDLASSSQSSAALPVTSTNRAGRLIIEGQGAAGYVEKSSIRVEYDN